MLIRLSEMSPLPLREQIVRRITELILSGELGEHEQLPSIRNLARQLKVGVVTVQRSYEDLERSGVIYSRQGKGFYVAPLDRGVRTEQAVERLAAGLRGPLAEGLQMGLAPDRILEIARDLLATGPDPTGEKESS